MIWFSIFEIGLSHAAKTHFKIDFSRELLQPSVLVSDELKRNNLFSQAMFAEDFLFR